MRIWRRSTFVNGLRFCKELDGKNFYFEPRNRVLNLEEYHRSLENLARQRVFNPATRRPWNEDDAAARWDQVQKQAITDKATCELVASLPELQKQLAGAGKEDRGIEKLAYFGIKGEELRRCRKLAMDAAAK